MSGLGRRSQYRKHLTDSVINDLPEPGENQLIAKVVATRGGNQFDITTPTNADHPQLAILPTKFHKLVWVRRNDYVIVQGGDDGGEEDTRTGVRFIIERILYKEQIKHLRSKNLWPKEFDAANVEDHDRQEDENLEDEATDHDNSVGDTDGIVFDQGYDEDEDLMANTNRAAKVPLEDSSEDESDYE